MFKLTDKEIEVLVEFIRMYKEYKEVNVFTSEFKKLAAKNLGMSNFNILNIYLKSLVEKHALIRGEEYRINPVLLLKEDQEAVEFRWK